MNRKKACAEQAFFYSKRFRQSGLKAGSERRSKVGKFSFGLHGRFAFLSCGGFISHDPFTVSKKGRDETIVYQVIETGFQGQGTGVVSAANE